jgi:serine/threonine-protein kinase
MIDVGRQVGDYEVLAKLGAGGVGRVYKVRHRITGRMEALKVLLPARSLDEESRERFLREVRVQANLQHPNIASVLTAFDSEHGLVLVMEFVEGESLGEYLERGRLTLDEQLNFVAQALSGLAYAHSRGVIHRDIKPENLLIGPSKTLKITDFGLAKTITDIRLTATGTPMGSVYYLAPEQVTEGDALDHRADIYSMGAVLYQLATGRRPFRGSQAYELMRAHLEELPTPPAEIDASIPPAFSQAILKAMAKDPEDRFASADEFSFALSMALRNRPAAAAPPVEAADAPAASLLAMFGDRRLLGVFALLVFIFAAVFYVASSSSTAPNRQIAVQQESPSPELPQDEAIAETIPDAAPAAETKPSPVQRAEAEPQAREQPPLPPAVASPSLPATVQVRILNAFGSDSTGDIAGEIISPPALAGYRVGGRVMEAKSSGKANGESDLKLAFTVLAGAAQDVAIASEIQGFRNSQGSSGVDENGSELKMKGGVLKRGKDVAVGIGSAVGGLFGRKRNRDRSENAATFTTKAARISFLPGSEFDLYVTD